LLRDERPIDSIEHLDMRLRVDGKLGTTHPSIVAPLPEVMTDRLDLRRFQSDDLDELAEVFANIEVWRFPYGRPFSREETASFLDTQLREWEQFGFGLWIARGRATNRVIGYVGITVPLFLPEILPAVEVGWRFEPASWGKGFASEGARAALDEAFTTLGLADVYSVPQVGNPASSAVCERIGMQFERRVTIPANEKRGEVDGLVYKMTDRQWRAPRG
jgi:RimJ/RimL family protein N-acetyltransferase